MCCFDGRTLTYNGQCCANIISSCILRGETIDRFLSHTNDFTHLRLFSYLPRFSRAQHCNYATLLAGRCGNNLWYSVIFPMGPSLFSMFVVLVRVIGLLRWRCIHSPAFYLSTYSVLYLALSLPRWAYLYRLEVFCYGIRLCPAL